jgi:hypothetical protein
VSTRHGNGRERHIQPDQIALPDFDIAWAGDGPWASGYWFGSDDGRIRFLGIGGSMDVGPYAVAPSGDAINGIAFAGDVMATSTRSEVVFLHVPRPGDGRVERAIFHGGSHGVTATQSGRLVASMGTNGILWLGPKTSGLQRVKLIGGATDAVNHYKIATLGSADGIDVIASAARRGGFTIVLLAEDGSVRDGRRLIAQGVDFVDVCSLNSKDHPLAAAALGIDGSIHLTHDVLKAPGSTTIRFNEIRGRAYRILCADGQIFMLTSRGLYTLLDLGSRFIEQREIDGPTKVRWLELEAVDVSLTHDRSLLVVMPDCVYRIEIDSLGANDQRVNADLSGDNPSNSAPEGFFPKAVADESWEPLDETAWKPAVDFDLAIP